MVVDDDKDEAVAVIAYSREVFNHVELRAELELLGHKFRTRTDTEVVLHACQEWATGAAERSTGCTRSPCGTRGDTSCSSATGWA